MAISRSSQIRQQLELHARTLGLHPAPGESDLDLALRVATAANGLDEDDPLHSDDAFWTMRDGTKIRVCDMSDSHLHNALCWLKERGHDTKYGKGYLLGQELERRRKLGPPEILCSQCGEPLRQLNDVFACDPCGRTVDGIHWDF